MAQTSGTTAINSDEDTEPGEVPPILRPAAVSDMTTIPQAEAPTMEMQPTAHNETPTTHPQKKQKKSGVQELGPHNLGHLSRPFKPPERYGQLSGDLQFERGVL